MLDIKRVHTGYIVARRGSDAHSHFKRRNSCKQLIHIIEKGLMPTNAYMREAARRVLTDEEFNGLKCDQKQAYVNTHGRV